MQNDCNKLDYSRNTREKCDDDCDASISLFEIELQHIHTPIAVTNDDPADVPCPPAAESDNHSIILDPLPVEGKPLDFPSI